METFDCFAGHELLHVGIRNHVVNDYLWVEVMVDSSESEGEAVSQRNSKRNEAPQIPSNKKGNSPADRSDCVDENDPACDLEEVRDEDN